MPHRSFGAARIAEKREPITFDFTDFGLLGEEPFTVMPDPSIGDTFDLYDLPDVSVETMKQPRLVLVISRFIRSMLLPEDRPRYDAALRRIPTTQNMILVEIATWIAEQVVPVPSEPPTSSSSGRPTGGTNSNPLSAGKST